MFALVMNQSDENVIKALKEKLLDLEAEKIKFLNEISLKIDSVQNTLDIFSPRNEQKYTAIVADTSTNLVQFAKQQFKQMAMTMTLIDTILDTVKTKITKFETSYAIAKSINHTYGLDKNPEEMGKFVTQVSSLLSLWKRRGEICSYQYSNSKKDNVWGRLEWLDSDGKPLDGYFVRPAREFKFG